MILDLVRPLPPSPVADTPIMHDLEQEGKPCPHGALTTLKIHTVDADEDQDVLVHVPGGHFAPPRDARDSREKLQDSYQPDERQEHGCLADRAVYGTATPQARGGRRS